MHWTDICAAVLVFQGVWADENKYKSKGYNEKPEEWPRIFAQERVGHVVVESSTIIAHPKITQAPVLRRKLGSIKWDLIHEGIQGQKRDAASCASDYSMCPESMGGGCCPNDRVCGTTSCYAAGAAPASACGMAGYIACGVEEGGGCCPSNFVCGRLGCTPGAGVSVTQTCGVSSYLCPASLGYGCCKNGMGCGIGNCYSTAIVTVTLEETTTATEIGTPQTLTSTTVTAITPQAPTGIPTTGASGVVPKVTSSPEAAIAKTKPSTTSSGGLTKTQLGGIIGGAILLLIVIIVATFLIIRRLNKVKVIVEASRSSSGPRSRKSPPRAVVSPDVETMSIDPLIIAPSQASRSLRHGSHPSQPPPSLHSSHHEVEASSPPVFASPWSPRSPPYNNYTSDYIPVSTSEPSSSGGYRNPSLESTPGHHQSPASYFDIPPHPDLRDQNLRFGHLSSRRPSRHERQWSESSDQSQFSAVSQTSSGLAELEAAPSAFQKALQGFGMGRLLSRRKSSAPTISSRKTSDPIILTGGPTGRPDWFSPVGLGHIPEANESRLEIPEMTEARGLTNAGLREMSLLERQSYAKKDLQEREYAQQNMREQNVQLLRDVDLGQRGEDIY